MDADRWQQLQDWFAAARARHPPIARHSSTTRRRPIPTSPHRSRALLIADESTGIMDAWAPQLASVAHMIEPAAPTHVGAYRIVSEIGRGGMGTVYLADRAGADFEHRVAIKLIATSDADDPLHQRFLAERRILAGLVHPNIARLLDGGVTDDGRPYLVMELRRRAADHGVLRRPEPGRPRPPAPFRRRLRCHPARAPEPGHPPRPEAEQHPRFGRWPCPPARLRHREADRPGPHGDRNARRIPDDDPGVRQPRTGARARRWERRATSIRSACCSTSCCAAPPPYQFPTTSPLQVATIVCEQDPPPPSARVAAHRSAPGAPPRWRSRQHRPDGDAEGAGAPLRIGRHAAPGRRAASRRAAGAGASRQPPVSPAEVPAPAPRRSGRCRDCDRGARRRPEHRGNSGATRGPRARPRRAGARRVERRHRLPARAVQERRARRSPGGRAHGTGPAAARRRSRRRSRRTSRSSRRGCST